MRETHQCECNVIADRYPMPDGVVLPTHLCKDAMDWSCSLWAIPQITCHGVANLFTASAYIEQTGRSILGKNGKGFFVGLPDGSLGFASANGSPILIHDEYESLSSNPFREMVVLILREWAVRVDDGEAWFTRYKNTRKRFQQRGAYTDRELLRRGFHEAGPAALVTSFFAVPGDYAKLKIGVERPAERSDGYTDEELLRFDILDIPDLNGGSRHIVDVTGPYQELGADGMALAQKVAEKHLNWWKTIAADEVRRHYPALGDLTLQRKLGNSPLDSEQNIVVEHLLNVEPHMSTEDFTALLYTESYLQAQRILGIGAKVTKARLDNEASASRKRIREQITTKQNRNK